MSVVIRRKVPKPSKKISSRAKKPDTMALVEARSLALSKPDNYDCERQTGCRCLQFAPEASVVPNHRGEATEVVNLPNQGASIVGSGQGELTAKLQIGFKMKLAISFGALLTVAALILDAVSDGVLLHSMSKAQTMIPDHAQMESWRSFSKPAPELTVPAFRVWERSHAQQDEFPYLDIDTQKLSNDFEKHEERRDTSESSTKASSPSPSPTAAPSTPASSSSSADQFQIPFRSYACNVVKNYWICSRTDSAFCVFFREAVPDARSLIVTPIAATPIFDMPGDKRIFTRKCSGKVSVRFIRAIFTE